MRIWDDSAREGKLYFENERIKEVLKFYLSERVQGRNLELGGGWYLSCPGSVVLDYSIESLRRNPSEQRLRGNADIGVQQHLPFKDGIFDSATLVSVYQYLHQPENALAELERIIKPGGRVHVVLGEGYGYRHLTVGPLYADHVAKQVHSFGLECKVNRIPTPSKGAFYDVEVHMPGKSAHQDHFRKTGFMKRFLQYELELAARYARELEVYPVTQKATAIRAACENMHVDGEQQILYAEKLPFEMGMIIEARPQISSIGTTRSKYAANFTVKQESSFCSYEQMMQPSQDTEITKSQLAFLSSYALNHRTKTAQHQLSQLLQKKGMDVRQEIEHRQALRFVRLVRPRNQLRPIDELVATKKRIDKDRIPVATYANFNHARLHRHVSTIIETEFTY